MALGPAVRSAGDWYGRTINVAARLCDAASAGELLATTELAHAVADNALMEPASTRRLKGIDEQVEVFRM